MEWKLSAGVLEGMTELKPNCVECNGNNTALIFWGYPGDMDWYLKAIEDKEFEATPGMFTCKFCQYSDICEDAEN